jgi:hypothetical protein
MPRRLRDPMQVRGDRRRPQPGDQKPQQRLPPADASTIGPLHPQPPGAHSQGLAAVDPKPAVKEKANQQQVGGKKRIALQRTVARDAFATEQRHRQPQRQPRRPEQHPQQQQAVVNDGCQPARQPGRRGRGRIGIRRRVGVHRKSAFEPKRPASLYFAGLAGGFPAGAAV